MSKRLKQIHLLVECMMISYDDNDIKDLKYLVNKLSEEENTISKRTLEMIDKSMEEYKKGNVSDPVDIDELNELLDEEE